MIRTERQNVRSRQVDPVKTRSLKAIGLAFLLAAASVALYTGCMTVGATGEQHLNLISEQQEIQMGREADGQIVATMGLYPDEALQGYVKTLGERIAATTERPNLPWTFRVVDDEVVNAFALPGGFIYVTRGILSTLNNEAQLAGVLGHEIGHVTAMHSVIRISETQLAQLGLGVAGAVAPGLQNYMGLAGAGLQLMFLKFSRDDEMQADELGVRYMAGIHENPQELISVMQTLEQVSELSGGKAVPEWSSTHPTPANREQRLAEQIKSLGVGEQSYEPVDRDGYLQRLAGMVYGPDPREGYSRDSTFYHPEMRFLFIFPGGWKIINQKTAVIGLSPKQDAAVQISLSREKSLDAAARGLFDQDGVSSSEVHRAKVNGLSTWTGAFTARTAQGDLDGQATFIEYGGRIYQLIGYSAQTNWPRYSAQILQALSSFAELTDPQALSVKPMRLRIERVRQSMTLREFQRRSPSAISIEELALINQVEPDTVLQPGQLVKRVTAE
jgi:predicted Zn-dependent protease